MEGVILLLQPSQRRISRSWYSCFWWGVDRKMKFKGLACLIGLLALAPTAFGQDSAQVNWEVFKYGTPAQVEAEIENLTEDGGLEARDAIGRTPLMFAAGNNSNLEVITALLKAGAEIEARDEIGGTPLMLAAENNSNPEVITALLKAGADAKAKDSTGKSALDYAKENNEIYKTKAYWELNDAFHNQD